MLTVEVCSGGEDDLTSRNGAVHASGIGAQPSADIEVAVVVGHGLDARAAV